MDITPFLKSLLSSAGISGYESPVADLISRTWLPLADEMQTSHLGSLHALRRGKMPSPRLSLLITAHMDAVGMLVAGIEAGFLRLTAVGSLDPRLLPGQPVTVHGRQPLQGVITARPIPLLPEDEKKEMVGFDHLLVDLGLPPRRLSQLVRAGDPVSFATEPIELGEGILSGHSLDNRASVAALTLVLDALGAKDHAWDVWCAATTQEEVSYAGGVTSTFKLHPDLAIVLDVTYGQSPGARGWEYFPLGGGPTLGIGPHIHPFLHKHLRALVDEKKIPHAIEPMPESSLTEAGPIQLSAAGVPTAVLSIPVRYMHSPVEVVALADIQNTAQLLTEFVSSLDADFLDRVVWDD